MWQFLNRASMHYVTRVQWHSFMEICLRLISQVSREDTLGILTRYDSLSPCPELSIPSFDWLVNRGQMQKVHLDAILCCCPSPVLNAVLQPSGDTITIQVHAKLLDGSQKAHTRDSGSFCQELQYHEAASQYPGMKKTSGPTEKNKPWAETAYCLLDYWLACVLLSHIS